MSCCAVGALCVVTAFIYLKWSPRQELESNQPPLQPASATDMSIKSREVELVATQVQTGASSGNSSLGSEPLPTARELLVDLMKGVEQSSEQREEMRMSLLRQYAGMAEDLGITQEQADRIVDLLIAKQADESNASPPPDRQDDPTAIREMIETQKAIRHKVDEDIAAVLGPAKAGLWKEYQEAAPSRLQVDKLRSSFVDAGRPLSSDQRQALIVAMNLEHKRQMDQELKFQEQVRSGGWNFPQAASYFERERLDERDAGNRRIVASASRYLYPDQLMVLQKNLDMKFARSSAKQ